MVFSALLALESHVLLLVRIGQTVLEHAIDERLVAKLGARPEVGEVVRGVGHGFGTASDDNVCIAGYDCLGAEDQGFDGGGADFVHSGCDGGLGEASTEGDLAGRVLSEAGCTVSVYMGRELCRVGLLCRENVAYEDLLDVGGLEASTVNGSYGRISNWGCGFVQGSADP
jgi:hypothetical protein